MWPFELWRVREQTRGRVCPFGESQSQPVKKPTRGTYDRRLAVGTDSCESEEHARTALLDTFYLVGCFDPAGFATPMEFFVVSLFHAPPSVFSRTGGQ